MPSSVTTSIHTLSLHDALPISILYSTHYIEEAEKICDEVAFIDKGKMIQQNKMEDLLRNHAIPAIYFKLKEPHTELMDNESFGTRSEEHTSELQSRGHLVCRLPSPHRSTPFPYTTLFRSPFFIQLIILKKLKKFVTKWRLLTKEK